MTAPIEDVGSLPGKKVSDQEQREIGKIKDVYAVGGDENPMYVTIDASIGMSSSRVVFVPLARLKEENGELLVPYSSNHLQDSPEIEPGDEVSEEDDETLRAFYGIDRGDQEIRTDNASYANQVPEGDEPPQKVGSDGDSSTTSKADTDSEATSKADTDAEASTKADTDSEATSDADSEGDND